MANWSKLHAFLAFFPEVQRADQLLPHRQKVIYTTISLFIFLAVSQLPLYGIQLQSDTRPDPLHWGRLFFASNSNTIFMLGISPVLLSEIMMQILVASKSINVDSNAPEARTFMNRTQKLMGMLITILGAVKYVLDSAAVGKIGTGN